MSAQVQERRISERREIPTVSPGVSLVIPVYNEEANLPALWARLVPVLDGMGRTSEVVFVDDGSADRSLEVLTQLGAKDPRVRVVEFNRNYGQHAAVFAGLEHSRGDVVVTLDADLQNPPEEIPTLLAKIDEGFEVVGGVRRQRRDNIFRKMASRAVNRLMWKMTGVKISDYGCMLRAYRREIVDHVTGCSEISSFIPALANSFAKRVAEVEVRHEERHEGRSRYNVFRLVSLMFDLVTGFSMVPIRWLTYFGLMVSVLGLGFSLFLLIRRLIVGPEVEGVFTLFAILFFFVGAQFLAFGLLGEYIGRIYGEARRRPRFVIRKLHQQATPGG